MFLEKLTVPQVFKKIKSFSWDPNFHRSVHRNSPLLTILNHFNLIHNLA
jgi:hypothetical protein